MGAGWELGVGSWEVEATMAERQAFSLFFGLLSPNAACGRAQTAGKPAR